MIKIDEVIEVALVAIYSKDVLSDHLYLKGGQALRIAHDMKSRFSADADFSTKNSFKENDPFFGYLEESLRNEFSTNSLYIFDFKYVRKPKIKSDSTPDFWTGWEVEFKIIPDDKKTLKIEDQRRQALIPEGSESPKIKLDISEHEYCESIDTVKVKSVDVKTYSRVLIVLEKMRAICQQHPDYTHRKTPANRARDYYDIERMYQKVLTSNEKERFFSEAIYHLENVFASKEVSLNLLSRIFDPDFVRIQEEGWQLVKRTVTGNIDDFSFYNESLKNMVDELQKYKG